MWTQFQPEKFENRHTQGDNFQLTNKVRNFRYQGS